MSYNKYRSARGWERRCVDFDKIHGDSSEAFQSLISSLGLESGMVIGDLMCGYGEVSRKILEYCLMNRLSVKCFLLEKYHVQMQRTHKYLAPYEKRFSVERKIQDIHDLSMKSTLDRAVIKMGLHELPKVKQEKAIRDIYLALKPRGAIYVWECMGQSLPITAAFREVVRKKDELAGLTSLVRERYFAHEDEIHESLEKAGFLNIKTMYQGEFKYVTKVIAQADLNDDDGKLSYWNCWLRENLSSDVKQTIRFNDAGDSISMSFVKKIISANK